MNKLRELLKQQEPSLYESLENAWTVANNEVFPAMSSRDESLNSSPHSHNLESYLNNILEQHTNKLNPKLNVNLTPYELYCMLMAILFHDIGRIISEEGHGSYSKLYIKNNFEKFNIPSEELADAIGDICEYHKPVEVNRRDNIATILLDAEKGNIRIPELAELLMLIDEMDMTYRRIKSLYVLDQPKYFTGKAAFRNYIKGVTYNSNVNAVIVSIDNNLTDNTERDILYPNHKDKYNYLYNDKEIIFDKPDYIETIGYNPDPKDTCDLLNIVLGRPVQKTDLIRSIIDALINRDIRPEPKFSNLLISNIEKEVNRLSTSLSMEPKSAKKEILKKISKLKTDTDKVKQFHYLLNLNLSLDIDETIANNIEKQVSEKWHIYIVLALIIKAVKDCKEHMKSSNYLTRLGIHVSDWLICYKEHLYDIDGNETFEPIFNTNYLKNVVNCMWNLITHPFGKTYFSFDDLASAALESNIDKIKLAVKRIDVLTRKLAENKNLPSVISYDNNVWRWENKTNDENKCNFIIPNDVDGCIDNPSKQYSI